MNIYRSYCVALGLLGVASCGVSEHAHNQQMPSSSGDFGPPSGTPVSTSGGSAAVSSGGSGPVQVSSGGTSSGSALGGAAALPSAGAPSGGGATSLPSGGAPPNGGASAAGGTAANSAAGSTAVLTLGGVDVPKDHAIAFIHIGHSNMAGRATVPTATRPYFFEQTHPHAWMYHVGQPPALAIEPKTAGDTAAAGPGTALVKEAALRAPNYYFISLGFAVPSAYCSQFIPGGLYYDQLIAAPKAIKERVTFGAIFIYLGITERHGTAMDQNNFANCINTLVTAIRTDVGVPNLPMMINDYEVEGTGEFAVGGVVANTIMPQIAMIPSTVLNSSLVSAKGLGMQDDHHFNLDGQLLWVQRAMMTMQDKGWFPWPAQ